MRIRSPLLTANCEETLQKGLRHSFAAVFRLVTQRVQRVTRLKTRCEGDERPTRPHPTSLPLSLTRTHNYTFKPTVVSCSPGFRPYAGQDGCSPIF